ncbi:MAG: hypothetical protein COB81_02305 [Flavobacteriaceae bacterium]|nr:MAG: hypothetical protein COB81_02305 [Flavobacteriaceae bacterium]
MRVAIIILILSSSCLFAQRNEKEINASFVLQEIALLDIKPNTTNIHLGLSAPVNPGEKARVLSVDTNRWLNFTSAIRQGASARNITVKIEDGVIPDGLVLKLKTAAFQGSGKGELGNHVPVITLTHQSQSIVENIRGAYTGNGQGNGYKLTYFIEINNYDALDINTSETITVSLTLSDF